MRDGMRVGDGVLLYHSSTEPPGVAGLARICRASYAEEAAWVAVDVAFVGKFTRLVTLDDLRAEPSLAEMLVLRRGQRLSIQPVAREHFQQVCRMGNGRAA
jgi:predicted RNA-binding protein with PUA-like domain